MAPVRMSELADRLGIARRSATSVVDELVDRGLVERRAEPATAAPSRSPSRPLDGTSLSNSAVVGTTRPGV